MMDRIIQQLKSSHAVLVASHTNPDGDAIGALLAMGHLLDALGKKATLFNESPLPAVYRFLPSVGRISRRMEPPEAYDTAIILDCGDLKRVGRQIKAIGRIPAIINIDHHVTNTRFGDLQLIDTTACATAEIVHRLFKQLDLPLNLEAAAGIYTGILTDTGSFRFSNTNRSAFAICHEMVALGVNPYEVAQHVYGTYSLGRIKLLNLALDSIEISKNGKLSMMTVTRAMLNKTGTQAQDADGLINYARRIKAVQVAALIHEESNGCKPKNDPGRYHVSLRSDDQIDVAAIASDFGGGGHPSAAGFSIRASLSALKAQLIELSENLTAYGA